ncbi:MAG: DMT family transporter [Actinomycetota bacterium]|nr:DMT family transporter [Actinomycetota bacterium]
MAADPCSAGACRPGAHTAGAVGRYSSPGARQRGAAGSLGAAVGWGMAAVFAVLADTSGLVLVFYRMWLGAALFAVMLLASGRRLRWRTVLVAAPGGVLLTADMTFFFDSIRLTSVAVATVIGALQPLLVLAVAGPFLGERVGVRRALLAAVAVGGVSLTVVGAGVPSHGHLRGDLLATVSLVAWSGYFIAAKRASRTCDALEYTTGATVVGAFATSLIVLATGSVPVLHRSAWVWVALLTVVPGLAHLLMNWAHRRIDAGVSSVIVSINPVVASVGSWVVLDQRLTALQVVGGAVSLLAITLVARGSGTGKALQGAPQGGSLDDQVRPAPG